MNKVFVLSLAGGVLLAGCGGGAGGSSSGGSSSTSSAQVSIDAMTSVPVVNGSATQGTLYVHNYGTSTASGVNFNLGSATLKTKLKSALAKIGLHLGGYEDSQGFILINPERCVSIPAGGSCAVSFSTPSMTLGNLGNSLVSLSYNSGNGTQSTSQVVNYNYVSLAALSGVNFTGGLNVTGTQGSTQHVVGYAYGGGISGTSYKNVNLNSTNPTTTISNGFINGQEVVAGQVIAVEFAVALQGDKTSSVNVTPTWGGSQLQSSKLQSHALNAVSVGSGVPLSMTLTPSQNTVNYIFGNVPILAAPTGTTAESISVVNNGNADGSGGLTATTTAGSGLIIDDTGCRSTALLSNGRNSCEIKFSTNSYIPGSAVVQYKSGATVVGSQTVVWTNDQPYPAVYVAPTPAGTTSVNPLSFGKGQPSGAIVFTITNVGKAPLTGVTYPVTNTGSATWAETSRTCTTTIGVGPSSSCTITGNLIGADDGTGQLYVKAVGSFNSTNYSFVSLPVNYIVTATPSLSITPNTSSLRLLANNTDIKTQVYTVKNNGNDPALFTAVNLLTPGSAALKPVITGSGAGVCANNTTLAENAECTVTVTYGPAAVNLSANESGVATLDIDYHGGTPDTPRNAQATLNYNLVGNDSYVQESMTATGLTGSGTSGAPYVGNANLNPMKITLTYTNPSVNYPMSNFNLNTNNLPYGLIIDTSNSTCATGAEKMNIESNGGFCRLVLSLDRAQLATASGSVVLNFTSPKATWTTPLGFYSQAGSMVYLNYAQPSVVFALSQNNGSFESTILSITGSNLDKGANPLPVNVAGVSHWLESSPVNPSSNCTVNPSTYAVSCNLTVANNVESVTYVMPNYLQTGESADIPLMFSTGAYGFLSPTYTFINYLAPKPSRVFLPQTGQVLRVPTACTTLSASCIDSPAGSDGYGRTTANGANIPFGIAWAYNGSGALTPATRFTVGTGPQDACVTDNLTGLMWIRDIKRFGFPPNGTWSNAFILIDKINGGGGICGYNDWYLPTVNDLASLLNDGAVDRVAWLNQYFVGVSSNNYWSSTTAAINNLGALFVNFADGKINAEEKSKPFYVLVARRFTSTAPAEIPVTGETGGATGSNSGVAWPSPRFVAGSNDAIDCITDKLTGLMWPKNGSIGFSDGVSPYTLISQPELNNTTAVKNKIEWPDALTAMVNLNSANIKLCGYSDWRLPNKVELRSLINYGSTVAAGWLMYGSGASGAPVCDGACFVNVMGTPDGSSSFKYWSSTTSATTPVPTPTPRAWDVDFSYGMVNGSTKGSRNYVIPVRGGQ